MNIANSVIDIMIWLVNGISSWLPPSFGEVSVSDFSDNLFRGVQILSDTYSFVEQICATNLLFAFLAIILTAEILMSFGVSGVKYLMKIIRG